MNKKEETTALEELAPSALDCLGVAVTIIDTKGTILFYNQHAARIVDRKPEYIENDIHSHHKKAATNKKLDSMIQAFPLLGPQHGGHRADIISLLGSWSHSIFSASMKRPICQDIEKVKHT